MLITQGERQLRNFLFKSALPQGLSLHRCPRTGAPHSLPGLGRWVAPSWRRRPKEGPSPALAALPKRACLTADLWLAIFPNKLCFSAHTMHKTSFRGLVRRKGTNLHNNKGHLVHSPPTPGEDDIYSEFPNTRRTSLSFFSVCSHNIISHLCAQLHSSPIKKLWNGSLTLSLTG